MNKLIKLTNDHYVVVDETIQPVNGYYYDSFINKIKSTNGAEYGEASHCWQITHSTQPLETYFYEVGGGTKVFGKIQQLSLQEVKELIGEVDLKKVAEERFWKWNGRDWEDHGVTQIEKGQYVSGFVSGYNQALEDNKEKKYTEEDVISIVEKSRETGLTAEYLMLTLQPKTQWEVELVDGKLKLK